MSLTLQKHSCINIYLMWKCWRYERRHRFWWDKNCLNFHEFTSSLVFGACPQSSWHVAVLVVRNFMNYAQKTTYHVSHYNHIVLCNFVFIFIPNVSICLRINPWWGLVSNAMAVSMEDHKCHGNNNKAFHQLITNCTIKTGINKLVYNQLINP